ncbi:MAG: amidohydrolase [Proteobacteria bacterium]|nr:amidohydrolase [Pseudomonadota bacterium]
MRIINAHVHMIEVDGMAKLPNGPIFSGEIPVYKELEQSLPLVLPETLITQMDEAGIAKSIIYAVEAPIVYASNEYVKSLCDQYPERLIGFASVNPKSPDAPAVLERAVMDYGLKGLKLHPPLQDFYPNSEFVFKVYEKALELNIPVVFHVGTTPFGAACKLDQANPLLIDDVAVHFPDLRIMLTHLGTLWHHAAFMVVEKHSNVFIDTAAYLYEIQEILTLNLIKRLGPQKIIFGTDYPSPFCEQVHRMKDFVDCINGLELPDDVLRGIFQDNVQALLNGRSDEAQVVSVQQIMEKLSAFKSGNRLKT